MKQLRYLFLFLCFLPLLYFRDFTPNNELKYLSIADEALRDGHFFAFWNHGMVYADKPPLYLWIVMLGKWLLGTHSMLFLGLFSLIPALVIVRVMDLWTAPYLQPAVRNSGIFMLMTSGLFVGSAIVIRMDMLMCMFIVLSLYTFFKIYQGKAGKADKIALPVYIFMAVFTKGPVGFLMPLLSIPVFLGSQKQLRNIGKYIQWKQVGILLGLCALWFCCVYAEGGKTYLNNLLFHQTVNRAVDSFHHKEPFWFYLKTIWYSLAPWILFYLATLVAGFKKHLINDSLKQFFWVVISTTFVALSIFSGKLDIYMLPIFPFIAYLALLLVPGIKTGSLRFSIAIPACVLALAFPGTFIAARYIPFPVLEIPVIPIATFLLTSGAIVSLIFLYKNQFFKACDSLATGLLVTIFVGSFAIPHFNENIGFAKLTEKAKQLAAENRIESYYYYQFRSGENMDAYLGKEVKNADQQMISEMSGKQAFLLFVRNKDLKREAGLKEMLKGHPAYAAGDYQVVLFLLN